MKSTWFSVSDHGSLSGLCVQYYSVCSGYDLVNADSTLTSCGDLLMNPEKYIKIRWVLPTSRVKIGCQKSGRE